MDSSLGGGPKSLKNLKTFLTGRLFEEEMLPQTRLMVIWKISKNLPKPQKPVKISEGGNAPTDALDA